MKIKQLLAICVVALSAFAAHADGISSAAIDQAGFAKLTPAQQAEIVKKVTESAQTNASDVPNQVTDKATVVDKVDKWVNVGERIGKMMGGAAREVGVAANEFVKTPVGQMTAALIIWNYVGNVVVHIVGGLIVMIVGFWFLHYVIRRNVPLSIEYDPERLTWWGGQKKTKVSRPKLSAEDTGWWLFSSFIITFVGLVTMFTY